MPAASPSSPPSPATGTPLRILIADDHPVVLQGLSDMLAREYPCLQIGSARDSREAVALLVDKKWDLLLLDINMPGRSGLDVIEEARRLQPRTPILVLSAYPEEEFAVRAFRLGASGYLNKNCVPDELMVAVRKVLLGGKYVTVALAERIASLLGGELRQAPHEVLSNRELLVLRLIARDYSIKEIAAELALTEKTIGTYRARIAKKTGLGTKVEITRYALQHGLVE